MGKLSLWKPHKSKDFKFFDRTISEMFRIGSAEVLVHKYLGPMPQGTQLTTSVGQTAVNSPLVFNSTAGVNPGDFVYGNNIPAGATVINITPTSVTLSVNTTAILPTNSKVGFSGDATQPANPNPGAGSIQDILFLENRDRDYDEDVYVLRGSYQRADNDFDLSQFGLFLQTGTVIMTFHHNDMIDVLGRRLMSGDVLEFLHLKDDYALNTEYAIKRFYVVGDCSWATEGFSPTWYPHLWRAKLNPMVDSQEYKDILNNITVVDTSGPMGTPGNTVPIVDVVSTYDKYIGINEAIIAQAEADVPASGYDVSKIYAPRVDENGVATTSVLTGDDQTDTSDAESITSDQGSYSPTPELNPKGYLTGDGLAPDGLPVSAGVAFPGGANIGDYYLRLDFLPNRLFRFNGTRWVKMEDNVRTNLTPGDPNNKTWKNSFINNDKTLTIGNGTTIPEKQSLDKALRPKADY